MRRWASGGAGMTGGALRGAGGRRQGGHDRLGTARPAQGSLPDRTAPSDALGGARCPR